MALVNMKFIRCIYSHDSTFGYIRSDILTVNTRLMKLKQFGNNFCFVRLKYFEPNASYMYVHTVYFTNFMVTDYLYLTFSRN